VIEVIIEVRMLNVRALAAAVYLVLFLVTALNFAVLPSGTSAEVAPVMFVGMIQALVGALLALWIYQDGENIKALKSEISKLKEKLKG